MRGLHYVISDIHGCYDKYMELLEKIRFTEKDILYILGDVWQRIALKPEMQCILKIRNIKQRKGAPADCLQELYNLKKY